MNHSYKFDSLTELVTAKQTPHAYPDNAKDSYARMGMHGFDYTDPHWVCADRRLKSHADITKALQEQVFHAGVSRVEGLMRSVQAPTPKTRRRKAVRASEGDELDITRVWQGDLEHAWRSTRREMSVGPSRVLIVLNLSATYSVNSQSMGWRGVAALTLLTVLREAGYVVSVVGGVRAAMQDGYDTPYQCEVTVVAPDQEADIHKLSNLLCSGLVFRGVVIDHILRVSQLHLLGGIAGTRDLDDQTVDTSGYDLVVHIGRDVIKDQSSAETWLQTTLKGLCESV